MELKSTKEFAMYYERTRAITNQVLDVVPPVLRLMEEKVIQLSK